MVFLLICLIGMRIPILFLYCPFGLFIAPSRLVRCLIVKTDSYKREDVAKVVQLRANVEGLKLGEGVLERLAIEGENSSLRYVIHITPAFNFV